MRKLLLVIMLVVCADGIAQQDAMYSQYMFNPFAINPAYAGSRNSYSAVLLHRSQWINIDGAPNTQSFALHAPTNKHNLAWGVHFSHDGIGPQNSYWMGGTIGYHLKFKKSKLAFALRGGAIATEFDHNALNFNESGDVFDIGGKPTRTVPSFDFGAYYYAKKYYLGLSVNHITKHQIAFNTVNLDTTNLAGDSGLELRRHFFLSGGYVFDIRPNVVLKPSALVKTTFGAPPNIDLNLSVLLYKRVWLGVSTRILNSIVFMVDVNITDFLRMGYAFDYPTTALASVKNNASHEIFIGFDFNLKSNKSVSPRYL